MALTELRNGRLPMRKHGKYLEGVSEWKRHKLIVAMVVGIETEIDDKIVGIIPPNTPLALEKACRAIGLQMKSGRALWLNPAFQADYKAAVETRRSCEEPKNIAVAAQIRDDPRSTPKDKVRAIECLRGPRPVAGTVVNVAQNNATLVAPAGYVVNLGEPMQDREPAIEGKTIEASPRDGNAGNAAADFAEQRAEEHKFRPR